LAIVWRDRRLTGTASSAGFDIYAGVSQDGGSIFEPNRRVSSASSPWIALGCCNSFLGVALTSDALMSAWGDYRTTDWDIYFQAQSIAVPVDRIPRGASQELSITENYPNPFSNSTVITYEVPAAGTVSLKIYDMLGRHYKTLVDEWQDAGPHQSTFISPEHPTGNVYYGVLTAGSYATAKKMMLLVTRPSWR
jgi:hypothetical protein